MNTRYQRFIGFLLLLGVAFAWAWVAKRPNNRRFGLTTPDWIVSVNNHTQFPTDAGALLATPPGGPTQYLSGTPGQVFAMGATNPQPFTVEGSCTASNVDGGLFFTCGGGSVASAIYGDGSDGAIVADGSTPNACCGTSVSPYIQTRDCFTSNLTVNLGASWQGGGYRLLVDGTLLDNGSINCDGANGNTSASPALAGCQTQGATTRLGGGGNGGTFSGGQPVTSNALGGAGGASNLSSGGAVTPPAQGYGFEPHSLLDGLNGYLVGNPAAGFVAFLNGGGGGGGNASAVGGGGGGVLIVAAYTLTGTGVISANGGNGVQGSPNESGGGGGGYVSLVTHTSSGFTGTFTANGGAAPAGAFPGSVGTAIHLVGP